MLNNTNRKLKVIGYTQTTEPRKVAFISFYKCEKCNNFPECINPKGCKFVEYVCARLPREQINYSCENGAQVLRLDLPNQQALDRAQQILARAQKLRTNRALTRIKIK
jgi:hypothetical protein